MVLNSENVVPYCVVVWFRDHVSCSKPAFNIFNIVQPISTNINQHAIVWSLFPSLLVCGIIVIVITSAQVVLLSYLNTIFSYPFYRWWSRDKTRLRLLPQDTTLGDFGALDGQYSRQSRRALLLLTVLVQTCADYRHIIHNNPEQSTNHNTVIRRNMIICAQHGCYFLSFFFRFSGPCCAAVLWRSCSKRQTRSWYWMVLEELQRLCACSSWTLLTFNALKASCGFKMMCFYFDTLVVYSNGKMFLGHFSWTLWTPNPATMWMDELCRCAAGGWMIRAGSLHTPLMASQGLQRSQRVLSPRLISQRSRVWHGTDGVQTVTR